MKNQLIRNIGKNIDAYKADAMARRMKLFKTHKINLILDVGANTGQYATSLRKNGYREKIISFEPLSAACDTLRRKAKKDSKWKTFQMALGAVTEEREINISGDDRASSFLPMRSTHKKIASYFDYVGREKVAVRRLDSILDEIAPRRDKIFLKIDAQGFEKKVLEGSRRSLSRILGIQIEMSLVPLYKGESLLPEMICYLNRKGFALMSLEYGFCDPHTGRMLQVDGIFFRGK